MPHTNGLFCIDQRWFAVASLAMLALIGGCPDIPSTQTPPDGGGDGSGSGNIRAEIVTPSSSFGVSLLDPPVDVRYSVPTTATDVRGFRVPVADLSPNSPAIDDRTVVATGLGTGTNRFFAFDPQEAGVGFFRVGILYVADGQEKASESEAVIQVEGSPDPVFIQPFDPLVAVQQGDIVTVTFDCRDPEGQVQWRLFYLASADSRTVPTDRLGTQLAVGNGNVGAFSFQTNGLDPDDYTLSLSATDSGTSIAATVAADQNDRIVTIPNEVRTTPVVRVTNPGSSAAPTIAVTAPGTADVILYKDDPFTIRFVGAVLERGATGTIEVFYDTDSNVSNGFTLIAEGLPAATTSVEFPTGVPEGTYFIGATIRDGVNSPVTDYATGRIKVQRNITLSVTEPNTSLAISPDATVDVKWTTNAPDASGTVDVFAKKVDGTGNPFGDEIAVLTGAEMKTRTAAFSSATPGLFRLSVRLNLKDGVTMLQSAPRDLLVSSLPAIIWLGAIAEADPRVDGVIFGGVNFEDNAGTAFASAGDLDDDGLSEFVISSRYGKPFFINPTGIGHGEAYVIYGERGTKRLNGVFNLNSLQTTLLRGVTLTGIRTERNSNVTEGLADVVSIPDADGDQKGELAFGFPRTDSSASGSLTLSGQFKGGGVVILSSTNSLLRSPTANTVINLDGVGQSFSNTTISPSDRALVLEDRLQFQEGNPDPDNSTPDVCVEGTDNVVDTIIGPVVGFVDFAGTTPPQALPNIGLAPARWRSLPDERGRLLLITAPPADETCKTVIDIPLITACFSGLNAGSGFFARRECIVTLTGVRTGATCLVDADCGAGATCTDVQPREPFGARIVGQQDQDHFGTSITISRPTGPEGPAELVISAPNTLAGSGIAYLTSNRDLWVHDPDPAPVPPPTPHQYIIDLTSHCSDSTDPRADPITAVNRIVGDSGDKIQNLLGIDDFNNDGRADIAVGAPLADGGKGRVYIAYRRLALGGGLEGDFFLSKLALPPNDVGRLDGLLITSDTADGLGSSLAGEFDFNGDKISDLVIGSPNANGGTGEVIILFGGTGIVSPSDGATVSALLSNTRTAAGGPVAARIKGNVASQCTGTPAKTCLTNADCGTGRTCVVEKGLFGFNVANAGDVDGDGTDDLLIAAPNASPRFDNAPNDGVDELSTLGVDVNLDGVRDEVPGDDQLLQAGLVYVVFGSNRLDQVRTCPFTPAPCTPAPCTPTPCTPTPCTTAADCAQGVACTLSDATININQLGTSRLGGLIIAGRRAGDRIGGGDAGDVAVGGNTNKLSRGRSRGLAGTGDVDGDDRADILIGAILADPRRDPTTEIGVANGGEAYLVYGSNVP
ncbi:MAG: hypothetical protein AAB341_05810 [Planctomycetota bacterium]